MCRFDKECRGQVAENMQKRGIHIHAETSPDKCVSLSSARLPADKSNGLRLGCSYVPQFLVCWSPASTEDIRKRIEGKGHTVLFHKSESNGFGLMAYDQEFKRSINRSAVHMHELFCLACAIRRSARILPLYLRRASLELLQDCKE